MNIEEALKEHGIQLVIMDRWLFWADWAQEYRVVTPRQTTLYQGISLSDALNVLVTEELCPKP